MNFVEKCINALGAATCFIGSMYLLVHYHNSDAVFISVILCTVGFAALGNVIDHPYIQKPAILLQKFLLYFMIFVVILSVIVSIFK